MGVYRNLLGYFSKIKSEIAIKALLGLLINATYVIQAIIMAKVVNLVWIHGAMKSIIFLIGIVVLMVFARGLLTREVEAYSKVLAARIKSKLRIVVLDQIFKLGPGYMSAKRSGKVTSLILDGIESLEPFFVSYIPQNITVFLTGICIFTYLNTLDTVSSLILILSMILCIVVPIFTVPFISKNVTDYWSGYAILTSQYIDTIQGVTTLKILNAEQTRGEELNKDASEFYHKSIKNTGLSLINSAIMLVLSAITQIVTVVIVALRVDAGLAPITAVTAFLFLAIECARPMMDLNRYWHSSFLGLSVAKELFELVETDPKVKDRENANCHSMDQEIPSIQLENISFRYPSGAQAVKNISLQIPSGSTVALVGRSGSGKSTILNLLLRFYDVSQGRILFNNIDIRDYSLRYLQEKIAVVFQDSFLFYGTVADNIRMAKPGASDEEVIHAAMTANAHSFITSMPEGYQTMVGERGMTLSGGERQRISIARAILKDAPILLLDEATSSVDAESEALIQKALSVLAQNRTTIIVAHRLSTIQKADKIFVLEEGSLSEAGGHNELLIKGGIYHTLVQAQEVMPS
jgi:ATP-binding cassette, subfamily C, bacterial CydD